MLDTGHGCAITVRRDPVFRRAPGCRHSPDHAAGGGDRKSTCLNFSHLVISYAVFCLKKKTACLVAGVVAVATSRRWAPGAARTAWRFLSRALALYFFCITRGANYCLPVPHPVPVLA